MPQELFPLGQVVVTLGVRVLGENGIDVMPYLKRHHEGDWGDIDDLDKRHNNMALKHNWFILSNYEVADSTNIWIMTENDRSVTTIMLPAEK